MKISTIFTLLGMTVCMFGISDGLELGMAIPPRVKQIWEDAMEKVKHFSDEEKKKLLEAEDGPLHGIAEFFGLTKKTEEEGEVKNWMNSFLHTEVSYGGQTFNVAIDSGYNLLGKPCNFVLDKCPEKAADGKTRTSCKRHKMEIFTKKETTEIENEEYEKITAIDGTEIGMKYATDYMTFEGHSSEKAKFMLLDGTDFNLFDRFLDKGALAGPKMDGIFSLALGSEEIRSGMEQLLAAKNDVENKIPTALQSFKDSDFFSKTKVGVVSGDDLEIRSGMEQPMVTKNDEDNDNNKYIATVYMQPFKDLDFFSKTKGVISIGELNQKHCEFGKKPEWLEIVKQQEEEINRRWKIAMDVRVRQGTSEENENSQEMKGQQVLLSTMDVFLFAPQRFTDPLFAAVQFVDDNPAFEFGRNVLGISGLRPKDVMIRCPSKERKAQMPKIDFIFGSKTFTLGPDDYIMPIKVPLNPIQDNWKVGVLNLCHLMIRPRPDSTMYPNFVLPEQNEDQWVFGQLFFNKACVAFKYGKEPKVSLAHPKPESTTSPRK